jgi:hypothetical protein
MKIAGRQSKTFSLIGAFNQILIFYLAKIWGTEASIEAGNNAFKG